MPARNVTSVAHDPPIDQPLIPTSERPMSLGDAANALGVPYHVVQRAARRGLGRPTASARRARTSSCATSST
jgi:hypothetical protein